MKYLFTTLATGESYLEKAILGYSSMNKILNCDFNITTNEKKDIINNINFDYFELDRLNDDRPGLSFYFNLKVLALKYALDKGYDFVIYNDADWEITENLSESKIFDLFSYMDSRNLDMIYERPANVKFYKHHFEECYFKEKLRDYNVFDHELWDEANVVNEQFLVFKVNWKFNFFVRRWEQFLWYSIANNIRSYAEGFEIGVSAYESKMNVDFVNWRPILRDCFKFKDREGGNHFRF